MLCIQSSKTFDKYCHFCLKSEFLYLEFFKLIILSRIFIIKFLFIKIKIFHNNSTLYKRGRKFFLLSHIVFFLITAGFFHARKVDGD